MTSVLSIRGITKSFGGVQALRGVTLDVERGECHAFMGENGAGKSTLGKIIAGIHRPDEGRLCLEGVDRAFVSPRDAARAGIGMVHQELAYCPDLSVAENLCLGRLPRRARVFLDRTAMRRQANEMLARIGADVDVARAMRTLTIAQQQLVQIASALGAGARLIIFDEPTSALSEAESLRLRALIRELRSRGVTTVYISHRMDEVFDIADRLTVLRDGEVAVTAPASELTRDDIVRHMIGRAVDDYYPRHLDRVRGAPILRVSDLAVGSRCSGISFTLHEGEILGIAGLVGAGRSDMANAIFGLERKATGSIEVAGLRVPLGSVTAAKRAGIALVPEDRRRQGLALQHSGRENVSSAILRRLRRRGFLDRARERETAQRLFDMLAVRAPSIETPVANLSGGNQQKVVLAKWLATEARVLIVDEPTRGIDVGAKQAIHALLDELAMKGLGILLISSDLPELLALSSRLLVMRNGRITGALERDDAGQEEVLRLMAGVETAEAAGGVTGRT